MLGNDVLSHFAYESMSFKGSQSVALIILLVWESTLQSLVLAKASEGCGARPIEENMKSR